MHFGQDELQLKTMTLSQSAHVEPTVLARPVSPLRITTGFGNNIKNSHHPR
ncbi:hypothetical protein L3X07_01120 [Levilactobacillus brevis]|nr:hypothetical protein [Levilactobacillus brevis]